MKTLIPFILKHHFILLFFLLEFLSLTLAVRYNRYQRATFVSISHAINSNLQNRLLFFRNYINLQQINKELAEENTRLHNDLMKYKNITGSYWLHDTIRKYEYLKARVVNNSTNKQYNYITIEGGSAQGIYPEMAVISKHGAVGLVQAVSENFATVIPLINTKCKISAKIQRNNYFGSIEWPGQNYRFTQLTDIPYHVDVKKGDTIITSGYSAIFPEGIIIGTVDDFDIEEGNFYTISVNLAVDFKNLHYVHVIKNRLKEEQKELERQTHND